MLLWFELLLHHVDEFLEMRLFFITTHMKRMIISVSYASFIDPVKYEAKLEDGTIVAKTREEGVEFYLNDGNDYNSFEINLPHLVL